jgi:hypothetical protein
MSKYKSSRELLAETADVVGKKAWAANIRAAKTSGIIDDSDYTKIALISLELRTDELDCALEERDECQKIIDRAIQLLEDGAPQIAMSALRGLE